MHYLYFLYAVVTKGDMCYPFYVLIYPFTYIMITLEITLPLCKFCYTLQVTSSTIRNRNKNEFEYVVVPLSVTKTLKLVYYCDYPYNKDLSPYCLDRHECRILLLFVLHEQYNHRYHYHCHYYHHQHRHQYHHCYPH